MKAEEAKRLADTTNYNFVQNLLDIRDWDKIWDKIFAKIAQQSGAGIYHLNFSHLSDLDISLGSPISPANETKMIVRILEILTESYGYKTGAAPLPFTYQIRWGDVLKCLI